MNSQKNNTLELLKLFSSYMVIFIHISFYGGLDVVVDTLARFAVPFFFLISGFYSYKITSEKIKKGIRNVFTLLILATVCYTIYNILPLLLKGNINGAVFYFNKYIDINFLIKLFIFNVSGSSGHLWYLFALIYVYAIFYFVTVRRLNEKVIFITSFLLLFLQILSGEFLSVLGIVTPIPIVRNFALIGIPFFGLGLLAKKHENKLCSIPNYVIVISVIIGSFVSILSRYLFGKNELYIGSLFVVFALVCVFIKYSTVQYSSFFKELEGCSTYIYIFHMMIADIINKMYHALLGINLNSSVILTNMHPILVCIATTVFAYCIKQIPKLFANKSKGKFAG